MEADAWDTSLMILGIENAKKIAINKKLAIYLIYKNKKNYHIWMSPEFKKFIYF